MTCFRKVTKTAVISPKCYNELREAYPKWAQALIKHEKIYKLVSKFRENISKASKGKKEAKHVLFSKKHLLKVKTNLKDMDDTIQTKNSDNALKNPGHHENKKDQPTEPIQEVSREEGSPSIPRNKRNKIDEWDSPYKTPIEKKTPKDLNKKVYPKDFTLNRNEEKRDTDSPARKSEIASSMLGHLDSLFSHNKLTDSEHTQGRTRGLSVEDKVKSPLVLKNSPIIMPEREPLKKSLFNQGARTSPSGSKTDKKSLKDSVPDSVLMMTPSKQQNPKRFSLLGGGDSLGFNSADRRSSIAASPLIKDLEQPSMLPSFLIFQEDSNALQPGERSPKKRTTLLLKKKTLRPKSIIKYYLING